MKKILIPALCVLALSACTSTQKYTINGTVEGETEGTVHLVKFQNRQADTLASAPIQDGKFKLEGSVQEVSDAYLTVDGKRGRTPLIIENTTFTATLNPADNSQSKVEGTANQKVINDYLVISNDLMKKQSELYKELADEESKLWHYSPLTLYTMYQDELLTGSYDYPEEA